MSQPDPLGAVTGLSGGHRDRQLRRLESTSALNVEVHLDRPPTRRHRVTEGGHAGGGTNEHRDRHRPARADLKRHARHPLHTCEAADDLRSLGVDDVGRDPTVGPDDDLLGSMVVNERVVLRSWPDRTSMGSSSDTLTSSGASRGVVSGALGGRGVLSRHRPTASGKCRNPAVKSRSSPKRSLRSVATPSAQAASWIMNGGSRPSSTRGSGYARSAPDPSSLIRAKMTFRSSQVATRMTVVWCGDGTDLGCGSFGTGGPGGPGRLAPMSQNCI